MAEDFPDFTRAVRLLGIDEAGDLVTVLVDSAGNLGAIVKGLAPGDVLTAVAVDASGRIVMVPYGTTTVEGTATVTQSEKDREVQGADGATLRTLAVDATGQLIMVPRGQSGNYMAVDASGFLSALVKGIDGGSVLRTIAVDTAGQIVMVPRGQSGYYMSVDASGYLTAVLKGLYSGALNTIAVDSNGRLEAFGLDGEDQWGQVLKVGNADLAARLGSPLAWDWRGNVLYALDFSTGYGPVITQTSGTGGAVALGPEYAGLGGYALKMTAGSTVDHYARAQLSVGANPATRVGAAFRFAISTVTSYVQIQLIRQKGVGSPWAYGRIDVANEQLQVLDSTFTWRNVGSVDVNLSAFCYGWLKLVVDQESGYYERILYNDQEIDASAYLYPTIETVIVGALFAELQNTGRSGNNDVVYLDQVTLTVNEPPNA